MCVHRVFQECIQFVFTLAMSTFDSFQLSQSFLFHFASEIQNKTTPKFS